MNVLVTGGAGYIGSAAVKALIEEGYSVVVVDNLSKGIRALVDKKAKFYEVDLVNKEELEKVFNENKIDAVMHFAAYKAVEESVKNPEKYKDNITGTKNLLDMMVKFNVKRIVYSSSAAVYGIPEKVPMDEDHPTKPINYYGETKLEGEKMIIQCSEKEGIKYVCLRYFNVAGDSGLGYVDPEALNIFPIIMEVIDGKRDKLLIFGNDYDTKDGTCIRDYIDINDLVRAHILALSVDVNCVVNLGTSSGVSVKELVDKTIEISGKNFSYEYAGRRDGDPPVLVASNSKAKEVLGWKPEKKVDDMIKSTLKAYSITKEA